MADRKIINRYGKAFTVEHYKMGENGKPEFVEKIEFKDGLEENKPLQVKTDTYWLLFKVKKNNGCTVDLSSNQVLDQITIKPVGHGGPDLVTVVKITAIPDSNDGNYPNETEDVIIQEANVEP